MHIASLALVRRRRPRCRRPSRGEPRPGDFRALAGSGEHVDLGRFLGVLEGVRTVPFSGEFLPDGGFRAPYTGPGKRLAVPRRRVPVEARVVAAADTWNAMTHDRVYRRALDFDAACAELLGISGSQLDPSVAQELLAIVREEHQVLPLAGELAASAIRTTKAR